MDAASGLTRDLVSPLMRNFIQVVMEAEEVKPDLPNIKAVKTSLSQSSDCTRYPLTSAYIGTSHATTTLS